MKESLSLLSCNTTQKTMGNHQQKHLHLPCALICQSFLALALLVITIPVFGQTYTNSSASYEGIITRSNDTGGNRMHYVKTGPTSGFFLYGLTYGGNNPYFNARQITGYNINDFTIFNDTVYFCGDDANGFGFYGWTSAMGLTWKFYICKLYNSTDVTSTDISRIKLFRSGQDLNVLLIGAYYQSSSSSYRSIFHIKNHTTCTVAYSEVEYFEDIALLDDYVVTLERKKGRDYPHEPHYMRVLNKNSFTLNAPLFDYYHWWSPGIESVGNVRLQHTGANRLVSVYCKDTAYYINTYSVNSNGILSLHRYHTIASGSLPTIGDVEYNDSTNTLVVLHNLDTAGTATFYDCTTLPSITLSSAGYPKIIVQGGGSPQTKLLSITRTTASNYVITGLYGNNAVFWDTQSAFCTNQRQLSMTSAESSINRTYGSPTKTTLNVHLSYFTKNISSLALSSVCQSLSPWLFNGEDE